MGKQKRRYKKIVIKKGVTSIGDVAFYNSSIKKVSIPKTVKTIGTGAFSDCYNLKSVSIPNGVTSIGAYAFLDTGIKSIKVPKSVKKIGTEALGYKVFQEEYRNIVDKKFIIYGYKGSVAEKYAKKNHITFKHIK